MLVNLIFVLLFNFASSFSQYPKLLLVSFDGFRYDLLTETLVPNIYKWAKSNTWFQNGVQSQYVSFTLPNHMSIATGLHEENHGILSNYFYDPDRKKFFDYFNYTKTPGNVSKEEFWYEGDPIWLTNERSNETRKSGVYFWPTGDATYPIAPHQPSIQKSWKGAGSLNVWMKDLDELLDSFLKVKDPINFGAWYVAEPDTTLHKNGFHNGALEKKLTELDNAFHYLIERIHELGLTSEINIILTADHGHYEIKDEKHVMCVHEYISKGNYVITDHMIYTDDHNLAKELMKNLTDAVAANEFEVDFHWKEDLPERWHYQKNNRIGAIVFEPKLGSTVSFSCKRSELEATYGQNGTLPFNSSTHGMDPSLREMRAFLVMGGPVFAKNLSILDLPENIDLYPLMCKILQIDPSPHDGSISVVQQALESYQLNKPHTVDTFLTNTTETMSFLFILLPSMCIVGLFFAYGCRHTVCKEDPQWGRTEGSRGYRPLQHPDDDGIEDLELGRPREARNNRNVSTGAVRMSGLLDDLSDDEI